MTKTITLIPGDGIGPEITNSVLKIAEATGVNIDWDIQNAGQTVFEKEGVALPKNVINSIIKNSVALKAPVTTPIGKGFKSVNVTLRKELNLYANLRPSKNLPNIKTKFDNVDLIVVRENTQDLYAGIERLINKDSAESIKLITRDASMKIAKFAFEYAKNNNRKEVCAVSKANICKLSDGLFLECAREVAKEYNKISYRELLIDNCCMQLVQRPEQFDVMLLPNLYGDIVSDLCAGLIGGLGIAYSANIGENCGENCAVFEAVHGSAPDIAGKNIANPTALILSFVELLKYIHEEKFANRIQNAVFNTLSEKILTKDLGGNSTCSNFTDAVINNL